MPLSIYFAFLVLLIGVVAAVIIPSVRSKTEEITDDTGYRRTTRAQEVPLSKSEKRKMRISILLGTLGGVAFFVLLSSATQISARSVGVETAFSKPVGTLGEGFHMINPFHRVEKFDASTQTLKLAGAPGQPLDGFDGSCVSVRLGNQTTACVDVSAAAWNLDPNGDVIDVYRTYKKFDLIEENAVKSRVSNALVNTLDKFDPLAEINGKSDATESMSSLAKKAQIAAQEALGTGIKLNTLQIFVNYDEVTQQKLNDFAKSLAETRIAVQNKQTAIATAQANAELAKNVSVTNPGVAYANCLALIRDLAGRGQLGQLPPTFNCGDPKSQVIVNAGK